MKRLLILLLLTLTSTFTFAQKRALTVEDLWSMKRISSYDVSPDGKMIVFAALKYDMDKNKGESDIYLINADGSGMRVLKGEDVSESSPAFSKDGKYVYFSRKGQIWRCDLNGENEKQITDFYSGIGGFEFYPDESKALFVSEVYPDCATPECNEAKDRALKEKKSSGKIFTELMYRHWDRWRGDKRSHLFLFDIEKNAYTDLTLFNTSDVPPIDLGSANDYSFSPEGNEVALVLNPDKNLATSTNNEVYLISLDNLSEGKAPELKKISVSAGNDNQPVYSPDGKYIAYRSMKRAGFEADKYDLVLYNRKTGERKILTGDWNLSVGEIVWSKDSKFIYCTTAYEIYNAIFKIDIETGKRMPLLTKRVNNTLKLSNDGRTLYFKQQRSNQPYEIFAMDLSSGKVKQITKINAGVLANIEMNEVETFWTEGAEGAKVQSILVKPPFFDESKKYPMIFLIHGGPQGHWTDDFHYRWNIQLFASKGYVVVATNPRGSVGYGQKFTDEISGDWGGKVYIDLMNSYDYAVNNFKFIDKKNTFAAGASYGGYMINWIEGHTDRFNALVCHDGVFNTESMYGSTEELWFPEWEFKGTPWESREVYQKWSPHMYVQNFKTPMLIVHGANDFRVPESQAFELFTSLQRMGVESKFLYFPDETHFVTKPQNSKLWWNTIFDWFEKHKTR